ncbi:hypothetical protein ABPG72_016918 [Tetrahymena utriculariae]
MDRSNYNINRIQQNKSQTNGLQDNSIRKSQEQLISRYNFREAVNQGLEISQQYLSQPLKYDSGFLGKFMNEIEQQIKQGSEYKTLELSFKRAVSRFATEAEGNLLKDLTPEQIQSVYRDIGRIFDKEEEGEDLKAKIRQVMNLRLEDMRRQIKDNKWSIILSMLQNLIIRNKGNRDCFDLLAYRLLPNDLRQIIWKFCLENQKESNEYSQKLNENRLLTISRFDVAIIKDTEDFVGQMSTPQEFDGGMIYCMKTILSYYEIKKDRILSDYLYLLCIPLMIVYRDAQHLHKIPVDLIGYYFSIQSIVAFFDPLVDLLVKHDEKYDAEMTDAIMNTLAIVDEDLANKINSVLNLELPQSRNFLVLIVKRFVHSLGFAFLPLQVTLYIWDQIIMKIHKNRMEIFVDMAIMLKCLKDQIVDQDTWDHIVDVIYQESKNISFEEYFTEHRLIMKNSRFYQSPYNVDPVIVNRGKQIFDNPLQQLIDQQQKRDRLAYKQKWLDEQEKNQLTKMKKQKNFLDSESEDEEPDENDVDARKVQLQKMKAEDIMKQMKTKQQAPEAMGMVPMINQNDSEEYEDQQPFKQSNNPIQNNQENEDDEDDDNFDVLSGMN